MVSKKFKLAHESAPTCPVITFNWGRAFRDLANSYTKQKKIEEGFTHADMMFEKSSRSPTTLLAIVKFLWMKTLGEYIEFLKTTDSENPKIAELTNKMENLKKDERFLSQMDPCGKSLAAYMFQKSE